MKKCDISQPIKYNKEEALKELQFIFENELSEESKLLVRAKKIEREFTKNLIQLRKEKGLTQKDIAEKTGLTQQAVSKLEQCNRKPTLPNLIRYLLGLDIDINELFRIDWKNYLRWLNPNKDLLENEY